MNIIKMLLGSLSIYVSTGDIPSDNSLWVPRSDPWVPRSIDNAHPGVCENKRATNDDNWRGRQGQILCRRLVLSWSDGVVLIYDLRHVCGASIGEEFFTEDSDASLRNKALSSVRKCTKKITPLKDDGMLSL